MTHFTDDTPLELCASGSCDERDELPDPSSVDEYGYCSTHEQWWKVEEVVLETEGSTTPRDVDDPVPELETELEWQRTSDVPARIKQKSKA